jgi:hypothetical protein
MTETGLQSVADAVVRRAQRQGYVVPRQVRDELTQAGLDAGLWKDVVALARPALNYRYGRYYHLHAVSERVRHEQDQQRSIQRAARGLIRGYRTAAGRIERRGQDRIDFIQPVEVRSEDGRTYTLLSRDLSTTGIRLIGTRSLLGHKVEVRVPCSDGADACRFLVRILWTCAVGDDLFENGGMFLERL